MNSQRLLITIVLIFFSATFVWAETPETTKKAEPGLWDKTKDFGKKAVDVTKEYGEKAVDKTIEAQKNFQKSLDNVPGYREERDIAVVGGYTYFDLWTLGKWGISGSWQDRKSSWDVQYQHGSLGYDVGKLADLGKLSEDRLHVFKRSYGNRSSFNWFYGGYYNLFKVEIGNEIMSAISQNQYPNADLLKIQTLGVTWGFGNRWQKKGGFIFGIDWFEINWPLFTLSEDAAILDSDADADDREDVVDVMDFLEKFPAITILRLQLGYSF